MEIKTWLTEASGINRTLKYIIIVIVNEESRTQLKWFKMSVCVCGLVKFVLHFSHWAPPIQTSEKNTNRDASHMNHNYSDFCVK